MPTDTPLTLSARLTLYEKLMRLDKPIGILLLAWPTLWGLWLSSAGKPNLVVFWIFALGVVLMRSAGCVMNDYADRHFDPHVERTRNRPLAAGLVSGKEALLLAAGLALGAFILILPLQNGLLIGLSVVAAGLAATYPYTKRFFAIPQAYLGIAFGFGIPMAYAAHLGEVPPVAWLLLVANMFWSIAYDTEYAMVDRADDLKIGIKTSAITFGRHDVLAVMLCYALCLFLLAYAGGTLGLGLAFFIGLLAAAGVAAYHYTLIRGREPARCFKAFLHNNWFGGAIFAGIVVDSLLKKLAPLSTELAGVPPQFERAEILIGAAGLACLAGQHVFLAGLGGVGSWCAEALARAGIGRLTLVDHDTVAVSNINRQLPALLNTVGRAKTEVLGERIRQINPDCRLTLHTRFIEPDNVVGLLPADADWVVDCIDSLNCKVALLATAHRRGLRVAASMGAGNKLDPGRVRLADIGQTSVCALAREVRQRLRRLDIHQGVLCVYSDEPGRPPRPPEPTSHGRARAVNGTISYLPPLFGLMLAGGVINRMLADARD